MPDIPKLLETFKTHPPLAPNFFSSYSITLPHPLATVYAKLGQSTAETVEAIARLSDLCTEFHALEVDRVDAPSSGGGGESCLLQATCRNAPASTSTTISDPSAGGSGSGSGSETTLPRQFFHLVEGVPLMFGLYTHAIHVVGCQTSASAPATSPTASAGAGAAGGVGETLYESLTDGGIHIRKTRRFVAEGSSSTRVDEVIEGHCGALLRPIVEKEAKRSHKAHMDQYHTLF